MMTLEDCRRFYAEEIRFSANIGSDILIDAFARVPRERFLGPGPWEVASPELRAAAAGNISTAYRPVTDPHQLYHNVVIVLDKPADINNGQPSALARWIDLLNLNNGDRVHHLGCGVGYYTAIISEVVGPNGAVVGSEVNPQLAQRAKENLAAYPNVAVYSGDGAIFDPGPYDAMLVNAGVTHPLPLWLDRMNDGARLLLPLTMATTPTIGIGFMGKITRRGDSLVAAVETSLAIYSCTSARDPELESVLRTAITTGALAQLKSVIRQSHAKTGKCLVHSADVCLSSAEAG